MSEPTYAELLTMLMCYETSFTGRWNGCKLYQKSNWVVFAIQALQAEIPQRPWCCMIMTSNDWRASSTLESGFKPTEDMHELHPLCSCRLNGEWRTRPHYVNIGKRTPWVLLRRWWILLCISEPWKGYNLWKREGTPSQWSKNWTGEECRRLSGDWSPTHNGVRRRSTPKPTCSKSLPFEGLPTSDLRCPRSPRNSCYIVWLTCADLRSYTIWRYSCVSVHIYTTSKQLLRVVDACSCQLLFYHVWTDSSLQVICIWLQWMSHTPITGRNRFPF